MAVTGKCSYNEPPCREYLKVSWINRIKFGRGQNCFRMVSPIKCPTSSTKKKCLVRVSGSNKLSSAPGGMVEKFSYGTACAKPPAEERAAAGWDLTGSYQFHNHKVSLPRCSVQKCFDLLASGASGFGSIGSTHQARYCISMPNVSYRLDGNRFLQADGPSGPI